MKIQTKTKQKEARKRRVRARIFGTQERPRLSVHRSNTQLRAQLINDEKGKTICAVSSAAETAKTKHERVQAAGSKIAELAKKHKIKMVVFDRGSFAYGGNIKVFAEAARGAGLNF